MLGDAGAVAEVTMTLFALLVAVAYVAGSVNFAILVFRALGREDPRLHYSQNPGATNVYRQAGPLWALVVLLLDVGRAFVIGWAAFNWLNSGWVPWVGLALILGNRYPCFHGFKGGKGVANYLGFTLAISPLIGLFSGLAWLAVFLAFRVPFYASFSMVAVLAVGNLVCLGARLATVAGVVATIGLIVYSHRRNIAEKFKCSA
jgi:glycerol-3-phosphate acyltransferase PlsY